MAITKKEENAIYKKAYEIHLADVTYSKELDAYLNGMCFDLLKAITWLNYEYTIIDLTEFMKLKPKGKTIHNYWWKSKNTNKTRISKYKHLIKVTSKLISNGI